MRALKTMENGKLPGDEGVTNRKYFGRISQNFMSGEGRDEGLGMRG